MQFNVGGIVQFVISLDPALLKILGSIVDGQTATQSSLSRIEQKGIVMSAQLDALTAQVAKNTDVIESAITLIGNIKTQLDAAGTDPAKLQALSDSLGSEDDKLAAAIAANTPAATT